MTRRSRGSISRLARWVRWATPAATLAVVAAVAAAAGGGSRGSPRHDEGLEVRLVSVERDGTGAVVLRLRPGGGAASGSLVAVEGGRWPETPQTVSVGGARPPVVAASRDRLVFVVPPLPPGPTRIAVGAGGGPQSARFEVLPAARLPGPPGDLARRYLDRAGRLFDEVEGLCALPGACPGRSSGSWQRVVFVIDASTSMDEADLGQPRIDAAKAAVGAVLDTVPHAAARASGHFGVEISAQVGLVAFAAVPLGLYRAEPTSDLGVVEAKLARLQTDFGTAMGPAIEEGVDMLGPGGGVLVVLGDGADHGLEFQATPLEAAEKARRQGNVTIHTVGLGAPGHHELDEALLKAVAGATGGRYFRASQLEELRRAFEQVFIDALTAAVVTGQRDDALRRAGPAAERALSTLRPLHHGARRSLAAARAAVEGLDAASLRDLEGFLAASPLVEALASPGVPTRSGGGAAEDELAACLDVGERVGRVLVEGATELVADTALPGWGAGVGWGGDLALGLSSPLLFDLGQHLDDALALRAWGSRVVEASMLATGCIDAVGAALAASG